MRVAAVFCHVDPPPVRPPATLPCRPSAETSPIILHVRARSCQLGSEHGRNFSRLGLVPIRLTSGVSPSSFHVHHKQFTVDDSCTRNEIVSSAISDERPMRLRPRASSTSPRRSPWRPPIRPAVAPDFGAALNINQWLLPDLDCFKRSSLAKPALAAYRTNSGVSRASPIGTGVSQQTPSLDQQSSLSRLRCMKVCKGYTIRSASTALNSPSPSAGRQ